MGRFTAVEAQRIALKARIGLEGPTNGGKTYSALLIAEGLLIAGGYVDKDGNPDWSKVAVIDTERRRSLFYADLGHFTFIEFQPPYDPDAYIEAVEYAQSLGCVVCIIDSLSHAWNGTGGLLEQVQERTANSRTKNSFTDGWGGKDGGTAKQNRMVDKILSADMHIIATFRQKMETVMEKDESTGKTLIKQLGTKPIQKDDLEYEFDITLKIDKEHNAEIIKNTVMFLDKPGTILPPLTKEFGIHLGEYLASGKPADLIKEEQLTQLKTQIAEYVKKDNNMASIYKIYTKKNLKDENNISILTKILNEMKDYEEKQNNGN